MQSKFIIPSHFFIINRMLHLWFPESKRIVLFIFLSIATLNGNAQQNSIQSVNPIHPRGVISIAELERVRLISKDVEFTSKIRQFENAMQRENSTKLVAISADNAYQVSDMLEYNACLFAVTANQKYVGKVQQLLDSIIIDSTVFHQPLVKGLTRANLLRAVAFAYDICYDELSIQKRPEFSKQILSVALSMQSTMGIEANYAQESNWMGVRYGAVLFAALVCDEPIANSNKNGVADALVWDARERLRDHIQQNINPDGWSAETMGYHFYNWSFIAPALIALEKSNHVNGPSIAQLAPHAIKSMWACATSVISIQGKNNKGLKADLADDNLGVDANLFWYALKLYPKAQLPFIKWTAQYLDSANNIKQLFLKMACNDLQIQPENPSLAGWQNFIDPSQGVTIFRNRFRDTNDIVATFTATAKRVRAHQSGDNLTFRILGLGNIWAIGAGRTGLAAGQTNLFPEDVIPLNKEYISKSIGKLTEHQFDADGSGSALASGSCMGVQGHQRFFKVDFNATTNADAIFVIIDSSENGRTWRLNTPEFNKVTVLRNGFLITAPNGSSMKATVLANSQQNISVNTGTVAYDGVTTSNNTGITFNGVAYKYSTAIDVSCNKNIRIILTLVKKGKTHPGIRLIKPHQIKVGNRLIKLR